MLIPSNLRTFFEDGKYYRNHGHAYSMISIISTGCIKRTGLAIIQKFLLNVPYDLIFNHVFLNVLVPIKRTGFDQAKHSTNGFKQNV